MANTYTSLHYHFTFSTKNREPWITTEIENRVWAYIGGIARAHKMTALQVGGVDDHIHAVVMAPPTLSPSPNCAVLERGFFKVDSRGIPEATLVRMAGRLRRVRG